MTLPGCHFFLGLDPQQSSNPKACDGALVAACALDLRQPGTADFDRLPLERDFDFLFCHARGIRGLTSRQWSGLIHAQLPWWGWANIMLDPGAGGGGLNVIAELADPQQDLAEELHRDRAREVDVVRVSRRAEVRPIVTREAASAGGGGLPILSVFGRGDLGVRQLWDAPGQAWSGDDVVPHHAHQGLHRGLAAGQVAFAPGFPEVPGEHHRGWPQDRVESLKCLHALRTQLGAIGVATRESEKGPVRIYTQRGTLVYQYPAAKDFAMAGLMCHAAFLTWLRWVQLGMDSLDEGGGGRHVEAW